MTLRNGRDYQSGLRARPREVWIDGERIQDVTAHPAFRAPVAAISALYDLQSDPENANTLSYFDKEGAGPFATAFMVPRRMEDLLQKHAAHRMFAEKSFGMLGRSPDFLNTTLAAMAEASEVFGRNGARFAENVRSYYEYVRGNDLFLTHALVTPQNDRSKASSQQADTFLHMGVVRETSSGVIVRGARMLATLGPVADELLVYSLPGLQPGDERHSLSFAIPIDTPGLRQIVRQPFDKGGNGFDHPLASRFEEPDSLVVFDDVLVPWERIFIHNDVALANAMYADTNIRQYTAHQTAVRGLVKLECVVGTAMRVASTVKADVHLHVQQLLGEAIDAIEIVKGCIKRAEIEFEVNSRESIRPGFRPLQTVRTVLPRVYPRVVETLQTIGAGGLLMLPSATDFDSAVSEDVHRYYQGAGVSALDRTRLFKLAWDICGDAFGQRALQYERYYAGDPVRLTAQTYLTYDKTVCDSLVDRALALVGNPTEVAASEPRAA
jgi:anthranilate 3-monooxygenase (FAD) / 4-hydroxyphenylacetate 3-monooxygenase